MNYLGHAYLSFGNAETLCGNMIGDFVKGMDALEHYPKGIRNGLLLHRHIDTYTDQHVSILEAKKIFRNDYGLYSGAVVDTLMDYFIANDTSLFADAKALDQFASATYAQLGFHSQYFPEKFLPYYESMVRHNWLIQYRTEEGLNGAFNGLKRRAKNIEEMETAFALFQDHKDKIRELYQSFISDIILFVKIEVEGY